ncbi:MAG: DUF2752 domain-containing protein [Lachnospiraceae bacterium]|nr:DUF2752 domain-containing protein [Lachnospiraceae bacterium]
MMTNKLKKIYDIIVKNDFLISFSVICIMTVVLFIFDIGCPTRYLTGICCPGCGMTRATIHLLKGDINGAIHYHPLVFTLPVIAALFIFKKRINTVVLNSILVLIIIAFISVYIIRILDPYNDVVYADIHKSILYKIIHDILGGKYVLSTLWQ